MRKHLLAIDPGTFASGVVVLDACTYRPLYAEKVDNKHFIRAVSDILPGNHDDNTSAVIEMVGHYGTGMPAGAEVFDTCVWIGRFWQRLEQLGVPVTVLPRKQVKLALCGHANAKDPHVIISLTDRFAYGQPNHGKGTKANPGWFYGFKADIWQAYALGVACLDLDTSNTIIMPNKEC
jgi:hypothetical protein